MASGGGRRGSQSKEKKDPCGKCGKNVSDLVNALTCDMCGWWFHARCEGVSDHTYQTIQGGAQGLRWFCRKCDKFVVNLMASIQQVTNRQDELEIKFMNMEKKLNECSKTSDNDRHERSWATVTAGTDRDKTKTNREGQESTIQNSVKEIDDRLARKKNIVLYEVVESQSREAETRKNDDNNAAADIIENGMGCNGVIESCRRLGAKKQDDPSPRPLLVKLQNQEQAEQCLKSWRRLKENPEYEHYGIKRDMTFLERTEMKKLVLERNKRRDQTKAEGGSEVWAIRGGKVINTARKEGQTTQAKERVKPQEEKEKNAPQKEKMEEEVTQTEKEDVTPQSEEEKEEEEEEKEEEEEEEEQQETAGNGEEWN